MHAGSDADDLAVCAAKPGPVARRHGKGRPLNHIGVDVGDLEEVERRMIARGVEPFAHGDDEPGRWFYVLDRDGIEFESVSETT